MSNFDFNFFFMPRAGVWIAPIYEILADTFFSKYNYQIKENELLQVRNVASITVVDNRGYIQVSTINELYREDSSFYIYTENEITYLAIHFENFATPLSKSIILNTEIVLCNKHGKIKTELLHLK